MENKFNAHTFKLQMMACAFNSTVIFEVGTVSDFSTLLDQTYSILILKSTVYFHGY